MKKHLKNTLATALLSVVIVSSVGATPVFAASSTSFTLNGVSGTGKVTFNSTSATATTTFNAGTSITAKVKVYYTLSVGGTGTNKNSSNTGGGGASAKATVPSGGTACGGKGEHKVIFNGDTWTSTTTSGVTW